MVNNYTITTYNTKSKYKDIDSVTFYPVRKIDCEKKCSAGDRLWWKWLGFIPLIPYKAKANKYQIGGGGYLDTTYGYPKGVTLDEIRNRVKNYDEYYFMNGLDIFAKATVIVNYGGKRCAEYHRFKTNENAMEFVENLKATCKKVGNDLN